MGRVVRVRVGVFFTEPPARMRTRCAALELFAYRATIRAKPERPAHLSFKICVRPSFLKTICWLLAAFKNDAINLLQKALVNQIRKLVQKYLLPYESKATRCSARALMGGGFALDRIIYDRIEQANPDSDVCLQLSTQ